MAGMGGCYCGRRGMPVEAIQQMYRDYVRLGSLSKVAKLHGRTRQNMFDIFKRRGLKLRDRNFKPQIEYGGRTYTLSKDDYFRDTIYRSGKYTEETFLHRRIWSDLRGPIPPGCTICFKDGNRANCQIDNLELLTHDEQQQRRGTGRNQFNTTATARLTLLLQGGGRQAAKLKGRHT